MGHFGGGSSMPFVVPFSIWLVASTPLLPMWPTAHFLEFAGPTLSGPMGDAPASICGWTPMGTRKARLVHERTKAYSAFVRSDQSATLASKSAGEAIKGPWGEGVVNAWGEEIWEWVCASIRSPFFLLRDRCKLKKRKARGVPPEGLSNLLGGLPEMRRCDCGWMSG